MDDDFVETASGLVPLADGWFLVKETGERISPEGKIYNKDMDEVGQVPFINDDDDEE